MSGLRHIAAHPTDEAELPFSAAIVAGRWVFVSGLMATGADGLAERARLNPAFPFYGDPLEPQSAEIFARLQRALDEASAHIDDVVHITQWFPVSDAWRFRTEYGELSLSRYVAERNKHIRTNRPASVGVGIKGLPVPGATLAVDVIGRIGGPGEQKESVFPPAENQQVQAGYSPAIRLGDWVFCAGEVPTDWKGDWNSTVHRGRPSLLAPEARINPYYWLDYPVRKQTEFVLQKLSDTAEAAGTRLENAVRAVVYLTDPAEFYDFEDAWRAAFPSNPPARVIVPHTGLAPVGARVEILLDIASPEAARRRVTVQTTDAPEPVTHEPQAIRLDDMLFLSGQMAHDEHGLAQAAQVNPLQPYYQSSAKLQLRYILNSVAHICQAGGTSLSNLVRVQQLLTSFVELPAYLEVWREYFPSSGPTGFAAELGSPLLVPGCDVLLDLMAYVPTLEPA